MSDLVSREAVYEMLNNLGGCDAQEAYYKGWDKAIDGAIEGLNKIPAADIKSKTVRKKIKAEYFLAVKAGEKNFELRKDEDDIQPGDDLVLEEINCGGGYTGMVVRRKVKYVLRNCPEYGLMDGYCIIGW